VAEGRQFSQNRNQLNKDGAAGRPLSSEWATLADGRILSGTEAYENGFVDELGGWRSAVKRAHKLAEIDGANLVTYQMPFSLGNLFSLFGKSDAKNITVDLGFHFPKIRAGLYYLSPTFLQ
jgi:ClpP class serine protease